MTKIVDNLGFGLATVSVCHLAQVALYFLVREYERSAPIPTSFFVLIGFGLLQLIYVLPLLIFAGATKRKRLAIGVVVAVVVTGLVNAVVVVAILSGGPLVP